jgi:uncharacterized protein
MFSKLMPRADDFFDDFDRQAENAVEGARLLKELLESFTDVQRKVQAIKDVEHKGDDNAHRVFERLHKQFITPFDRADMHLLMSRIDDVLDFADAAADRLLRYEVTVIPEDLKELGRVLLEAAEKTLVAVQGLRTIKKPEAILQACKEINELENRADVVLRSGLAKLFKSGADPLEVIKCKEIFDLLETATDKCEDVANVIEGVVLEHS